MQAETESNPPRGRPPYGIYAYTAREWDHEVNLYYYRARYYDPKIGRFISEDPLPPERRWKDEWDGYSYVKNCPLVWRDPLGYASVRGPYWPWQIHDEAMDVFPNPRGGPMRDRERHCWLTCETFRRFTWNRNPWVAFEAFRKAWRFRGQVLHLDFGGMADTWEDIAADIDGASDAGRASARAGADLRAPGGIPEAVE